MIDLRLGDCLETLRAMPDASVDSVVTDPPYGLGKEPKARDVLRAWLDGEEFKPGGAGFMGKSWDAFVPSPLIWAECLRVLKPGGHLVAFAGSRTYDWIVMGVRLAGFEVRDQLFWMYGSGFPKNLDVSKAIDRKRYDRADVYRVTAWIRETRDAAGVTNRQIDEAFGFAGMAGHWTSAKSQPSVPTVDQIPQLLAVLGVTLDDVPEEIRSLIWTLNGRKGQPGAAWFDRKIVGTGRSAIANTAESPNYTVGAAVSVEFNITAPATEAARQWEGWGTALKPSHEPIVLARKPLSGTVADNVLEHGTGAINVDACRISGEPVPTFSAPTDRYLDREWRGEAGKVARTGDVSTEGRWPANILHDGSPEVLAVFPETTSGANPTRRGGLGYHGANGQSECHAPRGEDTGSAARFYYCAKASRAERERGLDGFAWVILDSDAWENEGQKVALLVAMAPSRPRVIAVSGVPETSVSEWNTALFGSESAAPFLTGCSCTTSTVTGSTTGSRILSWLTRSITSGFTADANSATGSGGSRAGSAESPTSSITITSGRTVSPLGVVGAASPMRLRISVDEGRRRGTHPTVKPAAVMRWLVRLVTPPSGTVLDPYSGSGTTGVAAALEGFDFIGCELSPEYVEIARARISHAREFPAMWEPDYQPPDEVPEEQLDLFGTKDSRA